MSVLSVAKHSVAITFNNKLAHFFKTPHVLWAITLKILYLASNATYAQKGYTFFSKIQFTDLDYLYSTPSSCKSKWVHPKTKWPKALFQFLKIITQSNETLFGSTKRQTIAQPFVFKTKFISNQNLKWSGFYAVRKTGRAFRVEGKNAIFAAFFPGFRCLTNCISSTAEDRALKLGDRKLKWCMCLHFEY